MMELYEFDLSFKISKYNKKISSIYTVDFIITKDIQRSHKKAYSNSNWQ